MTEISATRLLVSGNLAADERGFLTDEIRNQSVEIRG